MTKYSIFVAAVILGTSLSYAQQPSGQTAGPSGFSTTSPQQQTGIIPQTNVGVQNRPGFGGTNQLGFGTTNPSFGTTNPSFAVTNPIGFGNTNGQLSSSTNALVPLATATNGSIIIDQSGAARSSGAELTPTDQAFVQRLQAALARSGGATQIFFPQTRSTVQVINQNGTLTLQGVVTSEAEKQSIETRVRAMQGVTTINNQLQVSANQLPQGPLPAPTPGSDRRLLTP